MRMPCFFFRRKFAAYIEGGLRPGQARRIEGHLSGCRECGELLTRIRAGHRAALRIRRTAPDPSYRLPEFEEIWDRRPSGRGLSPALVAPALLAAAVGLAVFLALTLRPAPGRGFTPLSIREFATRSSDRVVTEGFVRHVYFDEEERTLHIKLVEGPQRPEPFIICEIRDARGLAIPAEGSRVRVYGTARFDAQPGRGWHEVNPVTDIAVLNR